MSRLSNPIQPSPIDRNLIINLIRLVNNPINVLVLAVDLLAHSLTKSIKSLGSAVNGVPVNSLASTP